MPQRSARLADSDASPTSPTIALGSTYVAPPADHSDQASPNNEQNGPDNPFNLQGLPAEIRNRIYGHAFSNITTRDLSNFKIPPIVLASKQLCTEAVPVLFADSHFRLIVGSNFTAKNNERWYNQRGLPYSTVGFERDICGTIGIKHILNNFFKNVGDAALFRNVSLEVFDSFDIKEAREWERQGRPNPFRGQSYGDLIAVTLNLEIVAGSLQAAIVNGRRHPALGQRPYSGRVGEAMIVRDVDSSVDKAVEIAQSFADEEGFKGFKVSDLHRIATAFRLE